MRGFDGMPPPESKGKGKRGEMMGKEDPSIYGKIDQLAGQQTDPMAGGGGEQEASQMVMQAAQMLMQAGQMSPQFKPLIDQVMGVLSSGVKEMAGGGGGGMEGRMQPPSEPKPKKKKPKKEEEGEMMEDQYTGY